MTEFRSQFRLPSDLAEKLKTSAEQNHRSLNAEIVDRLEASYTKAGRTDLGTLTLKSDSGEVVVEANKDEILNWLKGSS